jgi:hypothetical protein
VGMVLETLPPTADHLRDAADTRHERSRLVRHA